MITYITHVYIYKTNLTQVVKYFSGSISQYAHLPNTKAYQSINYDLILKYEETHHKKEKENLINAVIIRIYAMLLKNWLL